MTVGTAHLRCPALDRAVPCPYKRRINMKRMFLIVILTGMAAVLNALDINLDARTDLIYTSYIKNSAFTALAGTQTLTAVDFFEKLTLKAKGQVDQVKFIFDGILYAYPTTETLSYIIDNAYISFENGSFVLYAGKQRMKWGTGYFFNPVDSLQPAVNIFRPTEDLEGIYALRGEFSNDIITPSVIVMPQNQGDFGEIYKDFNAAVQLYKLVGTCDIFVNYIYSDDASKRQAGSAVSWDNGMFVLNMEAALKDAPDYTESNRRYAVNFMIGGSKMISDELSIFAEYYRNNSGFDSREYGGQVSLTGYVPLLNRKDYAAYSVSYTWDNLIGFSMTGLHGLDDGTSFLFPAISYIESQNFDLQLSLLQNITRKGINEGNYSAPFYSAVELRVNAYF
jgi:hypothetical protein